MWKYLLFDCVVPEDGIDSYLLALDLSNYDKKLILTLLAAHLLDYLLQEIVKLKETKHKEQIRLENLKDDAKRN